MNVMLRTSLVIFLLLIITGCAKTRKPLYMWEQFPRLQYEYLQGSSETHETQIQLLELHAEKARAAGAALPPGFRAHVGMLHLANGNVMTAYQIWQAEKSAFPESAVYMDTLLKRLNIRTSPEASTEDKPQ